MSQIVEGVAVALERQQHRIVAASHDATATESVYRAAKCRLRTVAHGVVRSNLRAV